MTVLVYIPYCYNTQDAIEQQNKLATKALKKCDSLKNDNDYEIIYATYKTEIFDIIPDMILFMGVSPFCDDVGSMLFSYCVFNSGIIAARLDNHNNVFYLGSLIRDFRRRFKFGGD